MIPLKIYYCLTGFNIGMALVCAVFGMGFWVVHIAVAGWCYWMGSTLEGKD